MVFADEIVVFGEASQSNAHNIKQTLDLFILGAGQKINATKSLILPDSVHANIRQIFCGF